MRYSARVNACLAPSILWSITAGCDPASVDTGGVVDAREACTYTPAPRWVLRDKFGEPVKAMVEPRCGQWSDAKSRDDCFPLDFGSSNDFPCVRVIDHEGRHINLQFELSSGLIGPCQGGGTDDHSLEWKKDLDAMYLNETCEGEPMTGSYSQGGYFHFTRARGVFFAENDVWYASEEICAGDAPYWKWDALSQTCAPPAQFVDDPCVVKRIPDWVEDLLPNPPYTMGVEYE